ncbi:MAG: hypothetical protein M1827_005194 [Pycnora praestabilis]|nr:MAG: hypothetical protein M1827_005194 [Pycnora praestabilis]
MSGSFHSLMFDLKQTSVLAAGNSLNIPDPLDGSQYVTDEFDEFVNYSPNHHFDDATFAQNAENLSSSSPRVGWNVDANTQDIGALEEGGVLNISVNNLPPTTVAGGIPALNEQAGLVVEGLDNNGDTNALIRANGELDNQLSHLVAQQPDDVETAYHNQGGFIPTYALEEQNVSGQGLPTAETPVEFTNLNFNDDPVMFNAIDADIAPQETVFNLEQEESTANHNPLEGIISETAPQFDFAWNDDIDFRLPDSAAQGVDPKINSQSTVIKASMQEDFISNYPSEGLSPPISRQRNLPSNAERMDQIKPAAREATAEISHMGEWYGGTVAPSHGIQTPTQSTQPQSFAGQKRGRSDDDQEEPSDSSAKYGYRNRENEVQGHIGKMPRLSLQSSPSNGAEERSSRRREMAAPAAMRHKRSKQQNPTAMMPRTNNIRIAVPSFDSGSLQTPQDLVEQSRNFFPSADLSAVQGPSLIASRSNTSNNFPPPPRLESQPQREFGEPPVEFDNEDLDHDPGNGLGDPRRGLPNQEVTYSYYGGIDNSKQDSNRPEPPHTSYDGFGQPLYPPSIPQAVHNPRIGDSFQPENGLLQPAVPPPHTRPYGQPGQTSQPGPSRHSARLSQSGSYQRSNSHHRRYFQPNNNPYPNTNTRPPLTTYSVEIDPNLQPNYNTQPYDPVNNSSAGYNTQIEDRPAPRNGPQTGFDSRSGIERKRRAQEEGDDEYYDDSSTPAKKVKANDVSRISSVPRAPSVSTTPSVPKKRTYRGSVENAPHMGSDLPAGLSNEDVIDHYPNHVRGDLLLRLWRDGWTAKLIADRMNSGGEMVIRSNTMTKRITAAMTAERHALNAQVAGLQPSQAALPQPQVDLSQSSADLSQPPSGLTQPQAGLPPVQARQVQPRTRNASQATDAATPQSRTPSQMMSSMNTPALTYSTFPTSSAAASSAATPQDNIDHGLGTHANSFPNHDPERLFLVEKVRMAQEQFENAQRDLEKYERRQNLVDFQRDEAMIFTDDRAKVKAKRQKAEQMEPTQRESPCHVPTSSTFELSVATPDATPDSNIDPQLKMQRNSLPLEEPTYENTTNFIINQKLADIEENERDPRVRRQLMQLVIEEDRFDHKRYLHIKEQKRRNAEALQYERQAIQRREAARSTAAPSATTRRFISRPTSRSERAWMMSENTHDAKRRGAAQDARRLEDEPLKASQRGQQGQAAAQQEELAESTEAQQTNRQASIPEGYILASTNPAWNQAPATARPPVEKDGEEDIVTKIWRECRETRERAEAERDRNNLKLLSEMLQGEEAEQQTADSERAVESPHGPPSDTPAPSRTDSALDSAIRPTPQMAVGPVGPSPEERQQIRLAAKAQENKDRLKKEREVQREESKRCEAEKRERTQKLLEKMHQK